MYYTCTSLTRGTLTLLIKILVSGGHARLHLYIINWLFFPLKVISYLGGYFSQMFAKVLNPCTLGVGNLRSSA